MKIGNWYIINKSEYNKMTELQRELNRFFTPKQWVEIREGRCHVHLNPKRKVIQTLRPTINGEIAA